MGTLKLGYCGTDTMELRICAILWSPLTHSSYCVPAPCTLMLHITFQTLCCWPSYWSHLYILSVLWYMDCTIDCVLYRISSNAPSHWLDSDNFLIFLKFTQNRINVNLTLNFQFNTVSKQSFSMCTGNREIARMIWGKDQINLEIMWEKISFEGTGRDYIHKSLKV